MANCSTLMMGTLVCVNQEKIKVLRRRSNTRGGHRRLTHEGCELRGTSSVGDVKLAPCGAGDTGLTLLIHVFLMNRSPVDLFLEEGVCCESARCGEESVEAMD